MTDEIKLAYKNIKKWIGNYILYQHLSTLAEGIFLLFTSIIISLLTYTIIDQTFFSYKKYFFWILLLLNFLILIFVILKTILRDRDEKKAVFFIEKNTPVLNNELSSSMDFYEKFDTYINVYGYSEELIQLVFLQTWDSLKKIDPKKILNLQNLKKNFYVFYIFLCFFLLWIAIFPDYFAKTTLNFYTFESQKQYSDKTVIRILPSKIFINKNSDVNISIFFFGTIPNEATIYSGLKEGQFYPLDKITIQSNKETSYTIKNVQLNTYFYVASENAKSRVGQIIINNAPIITDIKLTYNYPAYTQLPPKTINNSLGNIKAIPGTKVKIETNVDQPMQNAQIIFDSGKITMDISDSTKISATILIKKPSIYYFSLTSKEGKENIDPIKYNIEVEKDNIPKIEITSPDKESKITKEMRVKLIINSTDDYGITKLNLNYQIMDLSAEKTINLSKLNPSKTSVVYEYNWDLQENNLFPGNIIQYYIEAYDNDTINGPKKGVSEIYYLRFPSFFEMYQETELEHNKQIEELGEIEKDNAILKSRMEEARKKMEDENNLDWSKENELKQIKESHEKIMDKMQNVNKELKKNINDLNNNSLITQQIADKVLEMQDLLDELMTKEMKDTMKKLNDAMKQVDLDEKKKSLLDAEFNQEKFMKKLERTIELLKRMRDERRLDVITEEAKELTNKQNEISKELEKLSQKDPKNINKSELNNLSIKQEQQEKETTKLQEDIMDLAENTKKTKKDLSKKLKDIGDKLKDSNLSSKMKALKESMKDNKLSNSASKSKDTASKLEQTSGELTSLKNEMRRNINKEILKMIQALIYNAIYISNEQEKNLIDIQNKSRKKKNFTLFEETEIDDIAMNEINIGKGVEDLSKILFTISKMTPQIKSNVALQLEALSKKMIDTKKIIAENDLYTAIPKIQEHLGELNQIIADFLKTANMMKKGMGQQESDDIGDQLNNLSNKQEGINNSTEMLKQKLEKNGELSGQDQELLEKMAYEQGKLKEILDELAQRYNKLGNALGKLDDVKDMMEEVKKTLNKNNLNEGLKNKQRKILSRLLDAQKSLQTKNEQDKKREAEQAKPFENISSPNDLDKKLTNIQKKIFLDNSKDQLDNVPLEYREITEKYFKALSEISY